MNKLVYIIILHYHSGNDTLECVESCINLTYENYRIIVIFNSSNDALYSFISNNYSNIYLIKNEINVGYAGGNNTAIKYALKRGTDFIWLLNNDTIVDPDSLSELVKGYSLHNNIGFLGSKILNYYSPEIIDYLGGNINMHTGTTSHILRGCPDQDALYEGLLKTDFVTGCSMFFSVDVIENIGLIDERYFLYCEDVDWSITAKKNGYHLFVCPTSIIYHKVHSSSCVKKGSITYYITRNTLFILERKFCLSGINWGIKFFKDIQKIFSSLCKFNLRSSFNILKGYHAWISGYQGPINHPIKVRENIFKVIIKQKKLTEHNN